MELQIDRLIIESTRRCQLSCEHCCRGDSELLDMDMSVIRRFFDAAEITGIHSLTISGGEPSLRPVFITDLIAYLKWRRVCVDNFYIATNAVNISKEFIFAVMQLWYFCDDNEISSLEWSNDMYHEEYVDQDVKLLQAFGFSGPRCTTEESKHYMHGRSLIAEGHAKDGGGRSLTPDSLDMDIYNDTMQIQGAGIYVNCEGMVIRGCDFSYESQREEINQFCSVDAFTHEFIRNEHSKELKAA